MKAAGLRALDGFGSPGRKATHIFSIGCVSVVWRAMLDAAPTDAAAPSHDSTMERDAARYRWLRHSTNNPPDDFYYHTRKGRELVSGERLDRAIDTAIAKEKP